MQHKSLAIARFEEPDVFRPQESRKGERERGGKDRDIRRGRERERMKYWEGGRE